jgi:(1->4)-alpha-D-glucan 1-alpha-D-glucosylmutase
VRWGAYNVLSMTAVKMVSPGVPDIYQGEELLELTLVDPDNRRPVDFARRRRLLDELAAIAAASDPRPAIAALRERPEDGRLKLWVIWRALQLRRERPLLFSLGDYRPLQVQGPKAQHVVAFARMHERSVVVAVAVRLYAGLLLEPAQPPVGNLWSDTAVDLSSLSVGGRWRDVFSGRVLDPPRQLLSLAKLLAILPVALLVHESAGD